MRAGYGAGSKSSTSASDIPIDSVWGLLALGSVLIVGELCRGN